MTEWLLCASSQIGHKYFQLPVAGTEDPEYRERVYCYELYHRWRCHWLEGFPFSLSGEVDKNGHPLIRRAPKPDFLVHIPGQMTNLLVMEAKPRNAHISRMVDDLKKLTTFRRDLLDQQGRPRNYYAAYFWIYGVSPEEWRQLRQRLLQEMRGNQEIDPSLISCYIHERSGARATPVS